MSTWRNQPALVPAEQIKDRHEADVVVVGLAHAGSAAVRAAAEAGAKVIGIEEKREKSFSVWGADVGHINSKFLESRGVPKVDPIDYYNEIQRRALGRANPGLMMRFAQNAGSAFDWYTDMVEDFSSVTVAFWAGGKLENGPIATMGGNFNLPRGFNCTVGQLWLDTRGKRFCNELFGGPEFAGMQGQQMKHGIYYNIFDSNVMEDMEWAVPAHESFDFTGGSYEDNVTRAMKLAQEAGKGGAISRAPNGPVRIVYGSNMEELLDNAELEGELRENVKNSIERYNELCRKGRDDDFGKDAKLLRPLDKWPLYIQFNDFDYVGRIMCTCGGLLTDETQNVLDVNYDPIPGLYATGNCCGRRYGPQYSTPTSGISIGVCITLGREAGKEAAK